MVIIMAISMVIFMAVKIMAIKRMEISAFKKNGAIKRYSHNGCIIDNHLDWYGTMGLMVQNLLGIWLYLNLYYTY